MLWITCPSVARGFLDAVVAASGGSPAGGAEAGDGTQPTDASESSDDGVHDLVQDRLELLRPILTAQTEAGLATGVNCHKPRGLVADALALQGNFARHGGFHLQEPVSSLPLSMLRRLQRGSKCEHFDICCQGEGSGLEEPAEEPADVLMQEFEKNLGPGEAAKPVEVVKEAAQAGDAAKPGKATKPVVAVKEAAKAGAAAKPGEAIKPGVAVKEAAKAGGATKPGHARKPGAAVRVAAKAGRVAKPGEAATPGLGSGGSEGIAKKNQELLESRLQELSWQAEKSPLNASDGAEWRVLIKRLASSF